MTLANRTKLTDRTEAPVPFLDLRGVHAKMRPAFDEAWETVLAHGKYVGGPEVAGVAAETMCMAGRTA